MEGYVNSSFLRFLCFRSTKKFQDAKESLILIPAPGTCIIFPRIKSVKTELLVDAPRNVPVQTGQSNVFRVLNMARCQLE